MMTLISANFLAIIALSFLINLANRNVVINNEKNRIYIYTAVTTIGLLILEIATIFIEYSNNNNLIVFFRIVNILGFSLSPIVPFSLFSFFNNNHNKSNLHKFLLSFPLYINAVVCILSYSTGFIFFVDAQNQYSRGPLFILPTLISILYYLLFIIVVIKNSTEYEIEDKKVIISIYLLPLIGIVVQILFKEIIIIWSCVSISLLLYYIFLLELQFRYDVQTKIKNRAAFENDMQQYKNGTKNATIVMFDLNNLKVTNDQYGHKAGDEMIFQAAQVIKECFMSIGTPYRIGGDEFCVICKEVSKETTERTLSHFDDALEKINQNRQIKVTIAHGHAFYNKDGIETIYSTLSNADKDMYTDKMNKKSL